jgi:hypothetical protein
LHGAISGKSQPAGETRAEAYFFLDAGRHRRLRRTYELTTKAMQGRIGTIVNATKVRGRSA